MGLVTKSKKGKTMMMKIRFKRLDASAKMPEYAHYGDSGMDVRSIETCTIFPGNRKVVKTGLAADIPDGYEIQVRPRSGMAAKNGVQCSWGTVDSGYKGEIGVNLFNYGCEPFCVRVGDRIAQFVVAPVIRAEIEEADSVGSSERGSGGFGSTGI